MPRRVNDDMLERILGGALKGGAQMMPLLSRMGQDGVTPPDFDFNDPQVQEEIKMLLQRMGPGRVGLL